MGFLGMFIMFLLVGVMVYRGLKAYQKQTNKSNRIITMTATLALISYFVHGLLNNFLDTDKLSIPVWGCMAIIVVMDLNAQSEVALPEADEPQEETPSIKK